MVLETKHKNWINNVIFVDTMHKPLLATFLTATIIIGFLLVFTTHYGKVQASTKTSDIPKPSIPEFTVKLVVHPYDVPPTNSTRIDPYTGEETITIIPGYHVENKSVEITIRNQPFTDYKLDNNHVNFFYNITYKGHYEEDWRKYGHDSFIGGGFLQSDSENTVISFIEFPTEGIIDIRVQAQIGYYTSYRMPWEVFEFNGEISGWSETQTLTIPPPTEPPTSSPTVNHRDTSPPTSPAFIEMEAILGVTIIAVIFGVLGFLAYLIRIN